MVGKLLGGWWYFIDVQHVTNKFYLDTISCIKAVSCDCLILD